MSKKIDSVTKLCFCAAMFLFANKAIAEECQSADEATLRNLLIEKSPFTGKWTYRDYSGPVDVAFQEIHQSFYVVMNLSNTKGEYIGPDRFVASLKPQSGSPVRFTGHWGDWKFELEEGCVLKGGKRHTNGNWIAAGLESASNDGSVKKRLNLDSGIAKIGKGASHVFLDETSDGLHIGDGSGKFDDVKDNYAERRPPPRYESWRFLLENIPSGGDMILGVYSVAPRAEADCPTVLMFNGVPVSDLRDLSGGGTDKMARGTIELEKNQFRKGVNEIVIREEKCSGLDAWNDSVITELKVAID